MLLSVPNKAKRGQLQHPLLCYPRVVRAAVEHDFGAALADARKVLGWPKICKLAHAFLWEYSLKRLKLAQLLGQLGAFLTLMKSGMRCLNSTKSPKKSWPPPTCPRRRLTASLKHIPGVLPEKARLDSP